MFSGPTGLPELLRNSTGLCLRARLSPAALSGPRELHALHLLPPGREGGPGRLVSPGASSGFGEVQRPHPNALKAGSITVKTQGVAQGRR